jgi:hypothetical protein
MYIYYSIDNHNVNKAYNKVLVIIMTEDEAERMFDLLFLFI